MGTVVYPTVTGRPAEPRPPVQIDRDQLMEARSDPRVRARLLAAAEEGRAWPSRASSTGETRILA